MTIPRMVGLLAALTVVGLGVVIIRVDQAAISHRIQDLQFRQVELGRQLWTQEIELARLRSPEVIRDRAERFGLPIGLSEPAKDARGRPVAGAAARGSTTGRRSDRGPAPVRRGERD
ncbi:MAG TPA: hypothetical protein VLM89_07000 [Phycisphaerae bacterium]|nr:hypothetical protein [Phycisphaerae bacterium]